MNSTYTTDVDYPTMYFHEQTPILMSMIALLSGQVQNLSASRFTYCDFGCGKGLTLNLLAACNPDGEFYGVDINPSHIASAKELAERTGLTNVTFIEASFDDLKPEDLPELDYAAVTGIYSWLPTGTRTHLVSYIENRLKSSGLCFIHYLSMPGMSTTLVTTALTQLLASQYEGSSPERAVRAVRELDNALGSNPKLAFNQALPHVRPNLARHLQMDPNYVAHDILNRSQEVMWFHQVARDFSASGLDFIGHARASMNVFGDLYQTALTVPYNKFCEGHEDLILREEILGLLLNLSVRMDIFGKKQTFNEEDIGNGFSNFYFHNLFGEDHVEARKQLKGQISMDLFQPIYDDILEGVARGDVEAAKIYRGCSQKYGGAKTRLALMHLIGGKLITFGRHSISASTAERTLNPSQFDRFMLFDKMDNPRAAPLPSKVMGACVQLSRMERILLAALITDDAREIYALVVKHKITIGKRGGRAIGSYDEFASVLPILVESFREHRLPELLQRGLLN